MRVQNLQIRLHGSTSDGVAGALCVIRESLEIVGVNSSLGHDLGADACELVVAMAVQLYGLAAKRPLTTTSTVATYNTGILCRRRSPSNVLILNALFFCLCVLSRNIYTFYFVESADVRQH